jgi:hypothetical protein
MKPWRNSESQRIGHHICRTLIRWTFLSGAFYRRRFRLRPTPVWQPYVGSSPGSGTGCCRPTSAGPAALSTATWRPSWRKMAAMSNRSICNRSRHNNQPFSGLPKATVRDEGLFFEKNHFSPRFIAPPYINVHCHAARRRI